MIFQNIHISKYFIKKMKRQATDWEKMFANAYLIEDLYPNTRRTLKTQ